MKTWPIFFLTIFLTGCASTFNPGSVARDWSCKIRELQVEPLFPPREDVQIGDTYITAVPKKATNECDSRTFLGLSLPKDKGFVPIGILFDSLEMTKEINKHYESRLNLPQTQYNQLNIVNGKILVNGYSTPEVDSGLIKAAATKDSESVNLKRLRIVGFPDFLNVKVSGTDVGAIFPIYGVPAEVALGENAVESASLSVPVAESYSIPAPMVIKKLKEMLASKDNESKCAVKNLFPAKLLKTHDLVLTGINEVYYTRAISSNILTKQEGSFAGAFGFKQNKSSSKGNSEQSTVLTPAPESSTNTSETETGDRASVKTEGVQLATGENEPGKGPSDTVTSDIAKVTASALGALAKQKGLPGVTIDISSGSSAGVSMTRIFDRPIAIGLRGVSYVLLDDGKDCLTLGQRYHDDSPIPLTAPFGGK